MSILYCLLFFLCLSLHACNARPLVAIDKNDDEKKGIDKLPVPANAKSPLSSEVGASRGERVRETSLADGEKKSIERNSGSDHETETSLVSVSWQVPRNKRSLKHPGFNSDYSPPKTHPPSHN